MSDDPLTSAQLRMVAQGVAAAARMAVSNAQLPGAAEVREQAGISEKRTVMMLKQILGNFNAVHQTLGMLADMMDSPELAVAGFYVAAEKVQQIEAGEGEYMSTTWRGFQENLESSFQNLTDPELEEVEVRLFLKTAAEMQSDWSSIMTTALSGDAEAVRDLVEKSRQKAKLADLVREEQCRLLDMDALDLDPEGPSAVRWDG